MAETDHQIQASDKIKKWAQDHAADAPPVSDEIATMITNALRDVQKPQTKAS